MARSRPRTLSQTALIPAASRAPETLTEIEAALNGEAIETFTEAVGGRAQLAAVLSVGSTAPDIEKIAIYLHDPRYREVSLRRICGYVGITVADLFAAYKKALIARAQIEATRIVAAKIPPIVTDVMDRALTDPTVERHKLALELGQLLEKKGGFTVNQNNLAANLGSTAPGSLEQLQQAVGDLLFGNRRHDDFTEGEAVRDSPPAEFPGGATEYEPELPFGDPRDDLQLRPRRIDEPGDPEE